jgi:hypothetical protein
MGYDLAGKPEAVRLIWPYLIARIMGVGNQSDHGHKKFFGGRMSELTTKADLSLLAARPEFIQSLFGFHSGEPTPVTIRGELERYCSYCGHVKNSSACQATHA